MKKKIRDLTIEELINICRKYSCEKCPFYDYYDLCRVICVNKDDLKLDKEVEL